MKLLISLAGLLLLALVVPAALLLVQILDTLLASPTNREPEADVAPTSTDTP